MASHGQGETISATFIIWVAVAFGAAVCWGLIVVLNKMVLEYVNPLPVNLIVLAVTVTCLISVAVPLSLLRLWPLGFEMTWKAAGYIVIGSTVTWLVAFNAYYYALRSGKVGVVTPISGTDPLFTALFAAVFVGAAIGNLTIVGLVVAMAGIVLISRWTGGKPEPHGQVLEGTATEPIVRASTVTVVVLSMVTAAGWGFSPVMIQLAEGSAGGASITMIVLGEGLGVTLLGVLVWWRRSPLLAKPLASGDRRRVIWLLGGAGALNALFAVLFYVLVDEIGPLLTTLTGATAPLWAILAGAVLLKERIGYRIAIGGAVTLTGVFLATLQRVL